MKRLRIMPLLLVVMALSTVSSAQNATGRIFGTVYDPQGAVIPAVQISVTNTATQDTRTATTNSEGYFQVLSLPIGNYKVKAEYAGFRTVISAEQKLLINQALRIDFKMEVGAAKQTVEVGAEAAPVETVNPTLGQSITGRTLTDMPLNGRDMLDLAMLQPGVSEANDDSDGAGKYSIAGGRTDSVTFLLDGGGNNDLQDNSSVLDPNPDAVAEFRLLTSDYTAEYGRSGGGVISVVTKSGSNRIHGSLFEFLRNRSLDANDYFNKSAVPEVPRLDLKRNQYGATLGGPMIKDKAFFFLAFQGTREVEDIPDIDIPVFQTAQLNGDFSNASIGGSPDPSVVAWLKANPDFVAPGTVYTDAKINPAMFSPVASNYITQLIKPLKLYNQSGTLFTTLPSRNNADELTAKFDYNRGAKDKYSATIGLNRTFYMDDTEWATVPGFPNHGAENFYFVNLSYTRLFTPTVLNEFHFVYHRTNDRYSLTGAGSAPPTYSAVTPQALGDAGSTANPGGIFPDLVTGPPVIYMDNGFAIGPSIQGPTRLIENTYAWTDAVSWTQGKNNWRFGAGFSPYQNNTLYGYALDGEFDFYATGGVGSGNDFADFLLGVPYDYGQGPNAPNTMRSKNTYIFGQDEWHASKNLVLTLGLRYEYNTPKSDIKGRYFWVIPGAPQSQRFVDAPPGMVFPGDKGAPWASNFPDKKNFAPRIGFAWDPTGTGKTSVRGGVGVFYDILKGEDNLQFDGQEPFFGNAGLYFNNPDSAPYPPFPPGSVCDRSGCQGPIPFMTAPFTYSANYVEDLQGNYTVKPIFGIQNTFPSHPSPTMSFQNLLPINTSGYIYLDDPHLRTPYVYQYNLSLQRNLFADMVLETNYVGSSSHGLTALKDINPTVLGQHYRKLNGTTNNCGTTYTNVTCYSGLPEFQNVANANYNAFEASLTRQPKDTRLGNIYYTFAYTFAHNFDDASGFRNRNYQVPAYEPQLRYASSDMRYQTSHQLQRGMGYAFRPRVGHGAEAPHQGLEPLSHPKLADRISVRHLGG